MTWKDFLENESFVDGVLETINRNSKVPLLHRGRIRSMSLDDIGLKIELSPVVQQRPDGAWEKIHESTDFYLEHDSLIPEGHPTFSPSQNIKWTIVHPGGGCVVVMSPVHPTRDGLPPLREACQFSIFYPPRPGSAFETETFGDLNV